jgi:hypothetical protein
MNDRQAHDYAVAVAIDEAIAESPSWARHNAALSDSAAPVRTLRVASRDSRICAISHRDSAPELCCKAFDSRSPVAEYGRGASVPRLAAYGRLLPGKQCSAFPPTPD